MNNGLLSEHFALSSFSSSEQLETLFEGCSWMTRVTKAC